VNASPAANDTQTAVQGVSANALLFGHFGFLNALTNGRLIASEREGLSPRLAIHSSSGASLFGGSRTPTSVKRQCGRRYQ
jgi:hypothetical protein